MSSDFFVVSFAIVWNFIFFGRIFYNENFTFVKSKNGKEKEKVDLCTFLVLKYSYDLS
jgi:hypothetical protein